MTTSGSALIDSVRYGGQTYYYFRTRVSDIDGSGSMGAYHGIVSAFAKTKPTPNRFSFQIIDSVATLHSQLARIDSILLSLGWKGSNGNVHNKLGAYSGGAGDNNNIRDDIAGLSLTGSGSEACTLVVKQNGQNPIQGARIVVRTLDQSATKVPGLFTGTNGRGIAELDNSSYYISITANNYIPIADTLLVNGDSTWNFSMALFDPGNPPSPDLCRVYGWIFDITGDSLADISVIAEIPAEYQPEKFGDVIITPFRKSTVTDSTGYWQIDLFPNAVLSDPLSRYLFTIQYPSGVIYKSEVTVPDSTSWQLK
jgi:hypothetical protein